MATSMGTGVCIGQDVNLDSHIDRWKLDLHSWSLGQEVTVAPRLWIGCNRPGGHGKISKIHYNYDEKTGNQVSVQSVDVKYTVERGCDTNVPLGFVELHAQLERSRRSRRRVEPDAASEKENLAQPIKRQRQKNKKKNKAKKQPNEVTLPPDEDVPPKEIYAYLHQDDTSVVSELSEGPEYLMPTATMSARSLTTGQSSLEDEDKSSIQEYISDRACARATSLGGGEFQLTPSRHNTLQVTNVSCTKAQQPVQQILRVTLDQVYDHEIHEARIFVDQLVVNKSKNNNQGSPSRHHKAPSPRVVDPVDKERDVFVSLFTELLQDDDGEIEEGTVFQRVNDLAKQRGLDNSFDAVQLAEYLERLCKDDKVYRSDGVLYTI